MVKPAFSAEQLSSFADLFIGRRDDFALQRSDGRYRRAGARVNLRDLADHLAGRHTMGTYLFDDQGYCSFAVYDADSGDGLPLLAHVQQRLAAAGLVSYLEQSRRGGHLWVFFSELLSARVVRAWLLPFAPAGVEFFPKQDVSNGVGSLIRVPLGVHQLTGRRYPFVTWQDGQALPYTRSLAEMVVHCLANFQRVPVPTALFLQPGQPRYSQPGHKKTSITRNVPAGTMPASRTIADWCAVQDPFSLIGRYLMLDRRGMGHCPFTERHNDGYDQHPSFRVYAPARPGGCCWHCYACQLTGNVFNFLERYHGLSARELWRRIQEREVL